MSIYNAMQSGIRGLGAQATKVSKISDNIANANTVGYKRTFVDLVTTTSSSTGATSFPAGVKAVISNDIGKQGAFSSTSSETDLSIAGSGFFVVAKQPNEPVESNYMLTRAGSFKPDEDGYLRNSAGFYLHGFRHQEDGTLGMVDRSSFSDLQAINIKDVSMQSSATTEVSVSGNLPAQETGLVTPGSPFISSTEYYSPLGEKQKLSFEWQPTATDSEWDLTLSDGNGTDYGRVTVTFNDSGPNAGSPAAWSNVTNLAAAPSNFAFNPATGQATLTIDNGTTPQSFTVDMGAPNQYDGMTQFAGDYTPQEVSRDGTSAGALVRTEIEKNGTVLGVFDNGLRKPLYQIPLGDVRNENGLLVDDGNTYKLSKDAGSFTLKDANSGDAGAVSAGSLELSNVDIAQELTGLIETQRAYSSNAKIITTTDEMLEETTRLKR
ncbi:flagellar hook protein FlgE [Sulfitobacter sp. R18_1]|uniref:flagellar hook protein FlgE n=1 Tax=Sulfitobacter sp. R18_1 TaxID=2821104 RepID=UPI001ADBA1B6|nr:flagellar hook protein FlgE [Sulfitobacter sp. R18_1]MBO9428640.1 flagellar hook protein FlgE [Sulfitobacter sp. R18_1]